MKTVWRYRRLSSTPMRWAQLLVCVSLLVHAAYGASAVLKQLRPQGAQRGKPFRLTLVGKNLLEGAKIVSTLPASFTPLTPQNELAAVKNYDELPFLVELPADAPVGLYPIRVITAEGLSNLLLFSVGVFPELIEQESEQLVHKPANDSPETSESVSVPVTVNGRLTGPDRDVYKIRGKKGERLILEIEARRAGSALDPVLRLLDGQKKPVAVSQDASGLGLDSRIDVSLPATGDYYAVVHDARFSEQEDNSYRLKIGQFAYADGIFPLGWRRGEKAKVQLIGGNVASGTEVTADVSAVKEKDEFTKVSVPGAPGGLPFVFAVSDLPEMLEPAGEPLISLPHATVMNGRISKPEEVDRYRLAVSPGENWTIELAAAELGTSELFGRITLFDSNGKRLASAGDDIPNPDEFSLIVPGRTSSDPYLNFEAKEGMHEVVIAVEDLVQRGGPLFGYRLLARKQPPDFTVSLSSPYVNLPSNGTAVVSVTANRRGYQGPIQFSIPDAGEDLIVEGGYIPTETREENNVFAASRRGVLSLTAKEGASPRTVELSVWAEATLKDGSVVRRRAWGPGLVTEVLGRTGVPDPNSIDRYRSVVVPWLNFELPMAVARAFPAKLTIDGPSDARFVQGAEYPLKWKFEAGSPEIRPPKKIDVDSPGIREVFIQAEDPDAEYLKEGTFKVKAVERMQLQKFNVVLFGEVEAPGGSQIVYSRPVTLEVIQGYRIEVPITSITLQPGRTAELAGKVVREPTFNQAVTIKAEYLPDGVSAEAVEVPGDQQEFRLVLKADASAPPGDYDIQLTFSSLTGTKEKLIPYKIPPMTMRLNVSATHETTHATQATR